MSVCTYLSTLWPLNHTIHHLFVSILDREDPLRICLQHKGHSESWLKAWIKNKTFSLSPLRRQGCHYPSLFRQVIQLLFNAIMTSHGEFNGSSWVHIESKPKFSLLKFQEVTKQSEIKNHYILGKPTYFQTMLSQDDMCGGRILGNKS